MGDRPVSGQHRQPQRHHQRPNGYSVDERYIVDLVEKVVPVSVDTAVGISLARKQVGEHEIYPETCSFAPF